MISKRLHPASFSNVNTQLAQTANRIDAIRTYLPLLDCVVIEGKYYNTSDNLASSSAWNIASADCIAGDKFRFTGVGSANVHSIVLWDGAGTVIDAVLDAAGFTAYEYTVPTGGVRIAFSYEISTIHTHLIEKLWPDYDTRIERNEGAIASISDYVYVDGTESAGYYNSNNTVTPSAHWNVMSAPCKYGDIFKVTMTSVLNTVHGIVLKDAQGAVVDYVTQASFSEYEYTVLKNGVAIYFSYEISDMTRSIKQYVCNAATRFTDLEAQISGAIGYNRIVDFTMVYDGGYLNSSYAITALETWEVLSIPCAEGETYRYSGHSNAVIVTAILIVDDADGFIWKYNGGTCTDLVFTIPYNGATIKFSVPKTSGTAFQLEKLENVTAEDVATLKAIVGVQSYAVRCYGDSLTWGNQDGTGVFFPGVLATLLGDIYYDVSRIGAGGNVAAEIAGIQGGIPIFVAPFTIPASSGTSVSVTLTSGDLSYSGTFHPACQSPSVMNPVTISGIVGNLAYSAGAYTFARSEDGDETVVSRPTMVITPGYSYRGDIHIIWVGTNDAPTSATIDLLMDRIDAMIGALTTKNYLVLGLTAKYTIADIVAVNQSMSRHYGNHFVDVRDYLIQYGLDDAGITPTGQDTIDISNGEIPTSLRYDTVHFNRYGYTVVANVVYTHGRLLGLWP